jgi:phosphodiesterase/alkaline phosphatase D-like protein
MTRKNIRFIIIAIIITISSVALVSQQEIFISGELLGRPTDNSISLELIPAQDLELYVEYGKSSGNYSKKTEILQASADSTAEIELNKLKKNTRYYYRIRYRKQGDSEWLQGQEGSFHTQRKKKEEFNFAIIADSTWIKAKV